MADRRAEDRKSRESGAAEKGSGIERDPARPKQGGSSAKGDKARRGGEEE